MTLHRRLIALAISLLAIGLTLTLTSCRLADFKIANTQVSQLVLTTLTDPKTFNPALIQEFPNIALFCYEGLTKEDGVTGAITPGLAESWKLSADQKRVVFTLRPNLKWSDGYPLTADDVIFTYRDVVFNPDVPTDAKDNFKIGVSGTYPQIRKLDDRRVEFLLPEPFAPFIRATAGPEGVAILPKHRLAPSVRPIGKGKPLPFISTWGTGTRPAEIVVNGPYQIEQFVSGQRAVFRRNPYYWRRDAQGHAMPYIERIIWQFIENTDTQLLRFRSNDLDVMGDVRPLRPEYVSLLKREEQRGRFHVQYGGPWSGTLYLTFNLNKGRDLKGQPLVDPIKSRWFNNPAFRQAVAYAIDRNRINNNIFRGLGVIQNSPISVQSPFFLSPEQGLKVYDYQPEQAKALLQQAGFRYNDRGELFDETGHRVQFTLLTNAGNKVREAIGTQIKQDLAKVGIQVDFSPINFNTLMDYLYGSRQWDAHMIGFTGGVEPHSAANLWMSDGGSHSFNLKGQPGQPPIAGWEASDWEREIDRLLIAGARELNEQKRRAIYGEFQKVVQENLPVIHLVNDTAMMAVRDRVQGLRYSGLPSWGLWNIAELKLR